jgi:hypothetical protein
MDDRAFAQLQMWADLNRGCHVVVVIETDDNMYFNRNCAAHQEQGECSHLCAVNEIKDFMSNEAQLARLEGPKQRGRPRLDPEHESQSVVDMIGTIVAARFDGHRDIYQGRVVGYNTQKQVGTSGYTTFSVDFEAQNYKDKRQEQWTKQQVAQGKRLFSCRSNSLPIVPKKPWKAGQFNVSRTPVQSPIKPSGQRSLSPSPLKSPTRRPLYGRSPSPPTMNGPSPMEAEITKSAVMGEKRGISGYKRSRDYEPEEKVDPALRSTTTAGFWCKHCHRDTDHISNLCGFVVRP